MPAWSEDSRAGRPGATRAIVPKGGDQLEGWADIRSQGGLSGNPSFRVVDGREHPASLEVTTFNHAAIDEK